MSLVTAEMKAKSDEIYHGHDICQEKSRELLRDICLPDGLLPLQDIEEVGYVKDIGFVWLKQKKSITHKWEKIDRLSTYGTEVTAYVEKGRIKKLTGVKTKELLIWLQISDIYVDDPPTGKVTFKASSLFYRTFSVSDFELDEASKNGGNKEKEEVNEAKGAVEV